MKTDAIKKNLAKKTKRLFDIKVHMKYLYARYYERFPVQEDVILMESFHGKTIGDSSLACAKEIQRLWPGRFKIYFATADYKKHSKLISEIGLEADLVDIVSKQYAKILATAGYIITNASLPTYFIRRDNQIYLQTWHGTPLKTLGKKMREGIESMYNVQHNFIQASHILFPNDFTREVIMRDYNLEKLYTGTIIMCGYPRNQVFLEKGRAQEIRRKYGIEDKTVYAYMPTWRGTSNSTIVSTDYFNEVREIFRRLDASMTDDQVMYVNFHPIIGGSFSFKDFAHIKAFPKDVDNYEFLNSTDALITDYSSVFFDYSLTRKPVILFMYDYEQYMEDRGVYMDIRDLPFRKIYDIDELCKCIAGNECMSDSYDDSDYAERFLCYDRPGNTEKLLRYVIDGSDEGLNIIDCASNRNRKINIYLPDTIERKSDFLTLAEVASDDDSVVMMYRKWFKKNKEIGQMLHDEFNDSFNYIITTGVPPRTYKNQIGKKLGLTRADEKQRRNDIKCNFGSLDVEPEYIRNYGLIKKGYKVDTSKLKLIEADVSPSDHGTIRFDYSAAGKMRPTEAVLLDKRYALIYERALTEDEAAGGYVDIDFKDAIEKYLVSNNAKDFCTPGVICTKEDGSRIIAVFTDKKKIEGVNSNLNELKQRAYAPAIGSFMLPKDYTRVDIKRLLDSPDIHIRESINSINMELEEQRLALIPALMNYRNREFIRVYVSTLDKAMSRLSEDARLLNYHFDDNGFSVKAFLPGFNREEIIGAELRLDSAVDDVSFPADVRIASNRRGCTAEIRIKYGPDTQFVPLRWHCRFMVQFGNEEFPLRIRNFSRTIRYMLKLNNVQSELSDNNILYPYLGFGDIFRICYREKTEYDSLKIRAKEITALAAYYAARPVLRRKEYYIIYEKFCRTAQDNSYYFFRYCMENLPESERRKFYYVIDNRSQDYQYVRKYQDRLIQFMSLKHMVLAMAGKLFISTDSTPHLYAWQTKPSFVFSRIANKDVFFLQHGVTAMKRVDHLFGKNGSRPMKYFVATSETEQRIIVNEFGYKRENVPITGFTRWDVLEDKSSDSDRFILVMPTWRVWLEDVSDEAFTESDYYKNYYNLLTSSSFNKLLEENDLRVVLYLHPKFAKYIEAFSSQMSDKVELIAFGSQPLNELMMRCKMLVTDYSSVCWDVLFMDKPVVFYQFDTDKYLQAHGSYIDLKNDLPSPRTTEVNDLIREVSNYVNNGFIIQEEYEDMLKKYFSYRDKNNCERTYHFLIDNEH